MVAGLWVSGHLDPHTTALQKCDKLYLLNIAVYKECMSLLLNESSRKRTRKTVYIQMLAYNLIAEYVVSST